MFAFKYSCDCLFNMRLQWFVVFYLLGRCTSHRLLLLPAVRLITNKNMTRACREGNSRIILWADWPHFKSSFGKVLDIEKNSWRWSCPFVSCLSLRSQPVEQILFVGWAESEHWTLHGDGLAGSSELSWNHQGVEGSRLIKLSASLFVLFVYLIVCLCVCLFAFL